MSKLICVFCLFFYIVGTSLSSAADSGMATVSKVLIPSATYFYMPVGDRSASIENDLIVDVDYRNTGSATMVFPGFNGVNNDGWYLNTDFNTKYVYDGTCYDIIVPVCTDYHPGEDWNGQGGGDTDEGQPVYSIGRGLILGKGYSTSFGNYVFTIHELPSEELVISFYAHLQNTTNLPLLSEVSHQTIIGYLGKTATTAAHLHWEIRRENMLEIINEDQVTISSVYGVNYWPGSDTAFITSHYYDPSDFIKTHSQVGDYPDGFHTDGSSKAVVDAFNQHNPKIGWPTDRGGGVYVHKWQGSYDSSYRVWLQDYQGDMNADHYGTDGQSALMLDETVSPYTANLIKEGFWELYKTSDGPFTYGIAFTEEIIGRYANSPYNQSGDPLQPGNTITVQKFKRVWEYGGVLQYNGERRTMAWKLGILAQHIPLGEFAIWPESCVGTCPQEGDQMYYTVDSNPANDKPWPLLGVKVTVCPTTRWFTKPGYYNFVLHNSDGSRKAGWGSSVYINEGNHQLSGDAVYPPENLTASAITQNSATINWTPGGFERHFL